MYGALIGSSGTEGPHAKVIIVRSYDNRLLGKRTFLKDSNDVIPLC